MPKVNLRNFFRDYQSQLAQSFAITLAHMTHSTAKGDAQEEAWIEVLRTYLPARYEVKKAFVLDCRGEASEQIDIVIFDRQYSPLLMQYQGAWYVPAESVYCVLEAKSRLDSDAINDAGKKVESVRRLYRTSATFIGEAGSAKPRVPKPIIGGVVTAGCSWQRDTKSLRRALTLLSQKQSLDIGCALQWGGFTTRHPIRNKGSLEIELSNKNEALIYFYLQLFKLLQGIGTVTAIDVGAYSRNLQVRRV